MTPGAYLREATRAVGILADFLDYFEAAERVERHYRDGGRPTRRTVARAIRGGRSATGRHVWDFADAEGLIEKRERKGWRITPKGQTVRAGLRPQGQTDNVEHWRATLQRAEDEAESHRGERQHHVTAEIEEGRRWDDWERRKAERTRKREAQARRAKMTAEEIEEADALERYHERARARGVETR